MIVTFNKILKLVITSNPNTIIISKKNLQNNLLIINRSSRTEASSRPNKSDMTSPSEYTSGTDRTPPSNTSLCTTNLCLPHRHRLFDKISEMQSLLFSGGEILYVHSNYKKTGRTEPERKQNVKLLGGAGDHGLFCSVLL